MSQKLCKRFDFAKASRADLVFSDTAKIRLNEQGKLVLKRQSYYRPTGQAVYPLDTDLTVTTWVTNPETLKSWLGFNAEPREATQPAGTSVRFKLSDGADDRWWDGGAWSVAGAADWNDEATIVANIATFPAASKELGVVINLVTTDKFETPSVGAVELLMECRVDYIRSIVADSMAPSLAEKIRPRIDITARSTGGTQLSLKLLETEYNIVSVDSVYDDDSDPDHAANLFSAYDPATMNLALTSAPERGAVLWVEMTVEPEVYINWASQDYIEVEKIPAIVIDNFSAKGNEVQGRQSVINNATKVASVRRSPFRLRLAFDVALLAEKNRTLLAMQDKALEHAATTGLLRWRAVDEKLSLMMVDEGTLQASPNLSDKHETRYSLRLDNVHLWLRPEELLPLIERVNLTLASPELEGGPRWTGA